jgi:hypothetical protein
MQSGGGDKPKLACGYSSGPDRPHPSALDATCDNNDVHRPILYKSMANSYLTAIGTWIIPTGNILKDPTRKYVLLVKG